MISIPKGSTLDPTSNHLGDLLTTQKKSQTHPTDFKRISRILQLSKRQGFVTLEFDENGELQNTPKTLSTLRTYL